MSVRLIDHYRERCQATVMGFSCSLRRNHDGPHLSADGSTSWPDAWGTKIKPPIRHKPDEGGAT